MNAKYLVAFAAAAMTLAGGWFFLRAPASSRAVAARATGPDARGAEQARFLASRLGASSAGALVPRDTEAVAALPEPRLPSARRTRDTEPDRPMSSYSEQERRERGLTPEGLYVSGQSGAWLSMAQTLAQAGHHDRAKELLRKLATVTDQARVSGWNAKNFLDQEQAWLQEIEGLTREDPKLTEMRARLIKRRADMLAGIGPSVEAKISGDIPRRRGPREPDEPEAPPNDPEVGTLEPPVQLEPPTQQSPN